MARLTPLRSFLICGASSGVGLALVDKLVSSEIVQNVWATARHPARSHELKQLQSQFPDKLRIAPLEAGTQEDYTRLRDAIVQQGTGLDVVINSMGLLHSPEGLSPERKIEEFNLENHLKVYHVNCVSTLMLAQALKSLLRESSAPTFAAISAKVGSIGDNNTGGWHSYRVSKAALNMAIRNLAIEMGRLNKNSIFVALHPGTTETKLSEPFMASARKKYKIHTPQETAQNLLHVLNNLQSPKDNGSFLSWDGVHLPW